jgi:DNA-binding transcriptional LysR family regulator
MDWNDLRYVLALARHRTLAEAARQLGVDHSTVFRRLRRLEASLGTRLFERSRAGYAATPAGEELVTVAQETETGVTDARRRLLGRDPGPRGTLRVTTTDTLLDRLLTPGFAAFMDAYPEIDLEIAASNQMFDLTRREADVAIRPVPDPPEHLVGREVASIGFAVYIPAAWHAPGQQPDLTAHAWVGPDDSLGHLPMARWLDAQHHDRRVRYQIDTLVGMREAVRTGLGCAVLPCLLGDDVPGLVRVGDPIPELQGRLWLLSHPDLRGSARVRAFLDFMADYLRARQPLLAGAPVDR